MSRVRGRKVQRPNKKTKEIRSIIKPFLIRAEPASTEALTERIPELYPLREKTIAVAGLGCVGAPSVLEFARCGVGSLRLLDPDQVSPGAICRWPLGFSYAGRSKSIALEEFIRANYPLVGITKEHIPPNRNGFAIGRPYRDFNQVEYIEKFLDGADLVYDATAEVGVNQYLADLCRERNIPFIFVSSRQGGWGGEVGRIRPGKTEGCYACLLKAQHEKPELNPPAQKNDFVQPVGCADPTFTAASFDTTEVSLCGVRLAVSTLCEGYSDTYPPVESDLAILSLRDQDGLRSIFPQWKLHPIDKHHECGCKP
jgi:molybdopterin/thiamine biosynthesis adenylyltransferase